MYDFLRDSSLAEVLGSFNSPNKFLQALPQLQFDLCLLDLSLFEETGFQSVAKIGNKKIVIVTNTFEHLKEAFDLCPLTIIAKPVTKEKLDNLISIAHKVHIENIVQGKIHDFELFYVAGERGKVKIQLSSILFVRTDDSDHRHKRIILNNGEKYILMNCSFERLLSLSSNLLRINKSELISIDAVSKIEYDVITLKGLLDSNKLKQVTLNRWFRKDFLSRISVKGAT